MNADAPATSLVMRRLSDYMAAAPARALPAEVVEKAKHHILDTFAAMVSGARLAPGIKAIEFAREYGGTPICSVAGAPILCGPFEAAVANGMLAHADETDDSHAPSASHPGCAVVPAALAAAEKFEASGQAFLRATALGYDVGTRMTLALGAWKFFQAGRSTHSIAGLFGAAAATAGLVKLTAEQCRWVLDYTAQQSSGITAWQRDPDHVEKAFVFGGMPARAGLTAACLVATGFTGVDDVLAGRGGYFQTYASDADPTLLVEDLGTRHELLRTNIKKWSVGSPIQAPLDAIVAIRERTPFAAQDVRKVTVRLGGVEARIVNNRAMPDICLQHMVALMLQDEGVSFETAHDTMRMKDPAILALRALVDLVEDDVLDKLHPRREAIVDIELTDGRVLHEHIRAVRGTPENPMRTEEVVAKCVDLIAPVLGEAKCRRLVDAVYGLEHVENMREIGALLRYG